MGFLDDTRTKLKDQLGGDEATIPQDGEGVPKAEFILMGLDPAHSREFEGPIFDEDGTITRTFFRWYLQTVPAEEIEEISVASLPDFAIDVMQEEIPQRMGDTPEEDEIQENTEEPPVEESPTEEPPVSPSPAQKPLVVSFWGGQGSGKTEQVLKYRPCLELIDVEARSKPLVEKLGFPEEHYYLPFAYDGDLRVDARKTLANCVSLVHGFRDRAKRGEITGVVLDSASALGDLAVDAWLEENADRKQPANPRDWGEVNDKIRAIIDPLLSLRGAWQKGLIPRPVHVVIVAHKTFVYDNLKPGQEIPHMKRFLKHAVDHEFQLYVEPDSGQYFAFCHKSWLDPFFTVELTDETHAGPSLLEMLERGFPGDLVATTSHAEEPDAEGMF